MVKEIEPSAESGTGFAVDVLNGERDRRRASRRAAGNIREIDDQPGEQLDAVGTTCAPMIDASKSISPCGIWQLAHWLSSICGPPGVIDAGGEVDIVMAGAAGCARGLRQNAVACAASVILRMADSSQRSRIGREDHRREVEGSETELMIWIGRAGRSRSATATPM